MKISLLLLLFILSSCGGECGFSESCHREKEVERIIKLTPEERERESERCVASANHMISITENIQKKCNGWSCVDGKEDWQLRMRMCNSRYENTTEHLEALQSISQGEDSRQRAIKMTTQRRDKERERCIAEYASLYIKNQEQIDTGKKRCMYIYKEPTAAELAKLNDEKK